jgi:FtsP/CotA-like multicopper oxidase with cupredoxin domain
MQHIPARLLAAACACVAVALLAGGCGGSTKPTGHTVKATVAFRDGKPVGGVKTITAKAGDRVRIVVKSDAATEVHLHGYDVMQDVDKDGTVTVSVLADQRGEFEMEAEKTSTQLAKLDVR